MLGCKVAFVAYLTSHRSLIMLAVWKLDDDRVVVSRYEF